MNQNKKKNKIHGIRVQWNIFFGMFLITMLVLIILWACQVFFINAFYQRAKTAELKSTTNEVIANLEKEDNVKIFEQLILEGDINVKIINISDFENMYTGGSGIVSATRDIGDYEILQLYESAKENGGSVSKYYTYDRHKDSFIATSGSNISIDVHGFYESEDDFESFQNDNKKIIGVEFFRGKGNPFFRNPRYVDDFLYAKLANLSDGTEVMVISDVQVTPLDSTVNILKAQLRVTSLIALFFSLIISYIVARRISRPIEKINTSALELSRGNYDTEFSGKGYTEIEQLSDTLNFTAKELKKVEQFRNEILANVSHDLRTPLTMIAGYAEVMRDIPGENTPENVQVIIDETKRLTNFVNDILDQSKLKSGIEELNIENVNITELLRGLKNRYYELSKNTSLEINLEADRDVLVKCDEKKVSQALYNLLDNAVNYTGDDNKVKIKQIINNKTVRIEITDTGKGIPKEKLPYIWDRYYRGETNHKRGKIGSGIGLSIVKSVFEAHRLKYGVESAQNKGSTFWVEFQIVYS